MRVSRHHVAIALLFIGIMVSCVEPYNPPESNNPNLDILVVDGFIDATADSAYVRLSKALPLNATQPRTGVGGMNIRIVSETGSQIALLELPSNDETNAGFYGAGSLGIDFNLKYKLVIEGGLNKTYESEFVPILQTPEIESVYFETSEEELQIFLDSKESPDKSRFYRWKIQETWKYNAPYVSSYVLIDPSTVEIRSNSEELYVCYKSDLTSLIQLGSTNSLTTNRVKHQIVNAVDRNSIKISSTYSINVQQFSVTQAAFDYWTNVKEMTESMGGLFDPMPGQVKGNISSISDPSELVIGFFSGSTRQEKRIFIDRWDLPAGFATYRPTQCEVDTVLIENLSTVPFTSLLINSVNAPNSTQVIGYTLSSNVCVDCKRYDSGTPLKPEFWP